MKNDCFPLLNELRKYDVFPNDLNKDEMIALFFPQSSLDLALDLSNVTSAFYGVMLQTCGEMVGIENINHLSKKFFYKLGRVKTKITSENIASKYKIPKDARGIAILLVSAIYNASPEYRFKIEKYNEKYCEISLFGIDRYYRITKSLNIEKNLYWPVLHTFMEGIKDELSINVTIQSEMISMADSGECHSRYIIRG